MFSPATSRAILSVPALGYPQEVRVVSAFCGQALVKPDKGLEGFYKVYGLWGVIWVINPKP